SHKSDYYNLLTHYTTLIELPSVDSDYLCAIIDTLCTTKQSFPSNLLLFISIHLSNTKDTKVKKALLNQLNSFKKKGNELILLQLIFKYKKGTLNDIQSLLNGESVSVLMEYDYLFSNKELLFMGVCYFFYENCKLGSVMNVNLSDISLEKVINGSFTRFVIGNEVKEIDYEKIEKMIYKSKKEIKLQSSLKENKPEEKIKPEENSKSEEKIKINLFTVKKNCLTLIIKNLFNCNEKLVFISLDYSLKNINTFLEEISYTDACKILTLLTKSVKKKLENKEIRFMKLELILQIKNHFSLECNFLLKYLIKYIKEHRAMELILQCVDDINLSEIIDLLFNKVIFMHQNSKKNELVVYGLNILREINKSFDIVELIKDKLEMVDQKEMSVKYAIRSIFNGKEKDITYVRRKMNKKERIRSKK
ncbi:hypothetical protein TUBRATIS_29620, partial [Tubulinosema ratisbonensis]